MNCKKCKGTELIPLIKNGRVIPHAWLDCVCRVEELEHYRPLSLEDFDFSCSDTFRGYFEEQCTGKPSPYFEYIERPSDRVEPRWAGRQWDKVQQLESEVVGWRKKHSLTLKEIDSLKAKIDRGTKKKYTIT